jgi:hypothetical protein
VKIQAAMRCRHGFTVHSQPAGQFEFSPRSAFGVQSAQVANSSRAGTLKKSLNYAILNMQRYKDVRSESNTLCSQPVVSIGSAGGLKH